MLRARAVAVVVALAIGWGLIVFAWNHAAITIAELQGGPLVITESSTGTVGPARRDLWLGFGLRNQSGRTVVIERIVMAPVCLLRPDVEPGDVFLIGDDMGPPPSNDDPMKAMARFDPAGFVVPAGQGCGGFARFTLTSGQGQNSGNVNLYRLLVTYRLPAGQRRSYHPLVYFIVFGTAGGRHGLIPRASPTPGRSGRPRRVDR